MSCQNYIFIYLLALQGVVLSSCATTKSGVKQSMIPQESSFEKSMKTEAPGSDLVFSFEISKYSLIDTFQMIIDQQFEESMSFDHGITVEMNRVKDLGQTNIELQGKEVLIDLPLDIRVKKNTFWGEAEAFGALRLSMLSLIDINESWHLSTSTQIIDYQWIEKPAFKVGAIKVPITWLTNEIIKYIKSDIALGIDKSIESNFDLPKSIQWLSGLLFQPYELSQTSGGYVHMYTDSIHISPAINSEYYSITKIFTPLKMSILSQSWSSEYIDNIPTFNWEEMLPDTSVFRLWVDLDYEYLTNVVRDNFIGQSFTQGNRTVTVEDVNISGEGDLLVLDCSTSGSFKGTIRLKGKPVFSDGLLTAEHVDFKVSTKNILHRTASWLAKGYIHNRLKEMLTIDLKDYISVFQKDVAQRLLSLKEEKNLSVLIDYGDFNISHLSVSDQGLNGLMEAELVIHVIIDDLRKLDKF